MGSKMEIQSSEKEENAEAQTPTRVSLSVVIPAYNEATTIGQVITRIKRLEGFDTEIIVVDDGSTDETSENADACGADRVIRHRKNMGYGAALKTAIHHARHDLVVTIDADFQHDPADIVLLCKNLDEETDMIIGDRSQNEAASHRTAGKWLLRHVAQFLTREKISDLNCGLRVFRRDRFLSVVSLLPDGFSFSTNLTLAFMKSGYGVKWIPIHWNARGGGKSRVNPLTDGINTLTLICRLITLYDPMRVFLPVSAALFILGFIYAAVWVIWFFNIPDGSVLLMVMGVFLFFFGLIADQISHLRRSLNR